MPIYGILDQFLEETNIELDEFEKYGIANSNSIVVTSDVCKITTGCYSKSKVSEIISYEYRFYFQILLYSASLLVDPQK